MRAEEILWKQKSVCVIWGICPITRLLARINLICQKKAKSISKYYLDAFNGRGDLQSCKNTGANTNGRVVEEILWPFSRRRVEFFVLIDLGISWRVMLRAQWLSSGASKLYINSNIFIDIKNSKVPHGWLPLAVTTSTDRINRQRKGIPDAERCNVN